MSKSTNLTEAECQNVTWRVVEITPAYRRSIGTGTHPVTGVEITVQKTEFLADKTIQALNTEERNSRDSKRWSAGSGSEKGGNVPFVRVARIPLNKFFADFRGKIKEGDDDHAKWLLNSEAYRPFRTKSGRL